MYIRQTSGKLKSRINELKASQTMTTIYYHFNITHYIGMKCYIFCLLFSLFQNDISVKYRMQKCQDGRGKKSFVQTGCSTCLGSIIKRQFRRCLTKPRSKVFSILPTIIFKHCLLLMVVGSLASQTRRLFTYLK